MQSFTREQMQQELREILAISALHIAALKSEGMAAKFLGLDPDAIDLQSRDPLTPEVISQIELSKFEASDWLDSAYRMVFDPISGDDSAWGPDYHHFTMIRNGLPQTDPDGNVPACLAKDSKVRWLLSYAMVLSYAIDTASFVGPHSFTVRDIALLANISEGAVRNALSNRKDFLSAKTSPEGGVLIECDIAFCWLANRRTFRPRLLEIDKYRFVDICRHFPHESLARLRSRAHWLVGSIERIAAKLNWSVSEVANLLEGKFPKEKPKLQAFAKLVRIKSDSFLEGVKLLTSWREKSK